MTEITFPLPVADRQKPPAHYIFICYVLFAIIAGIANLGAQELFLCIFGWPLVSVVFGTGIGFVTKYALEKRWVFFDTFDGHAAEARKIVIYGAFGVGTTLLFWGIELGCWHLVGTTEAKYTGAVVGLTLGNWIKYVLDKHFVFRSKSNSRDVMTDQPDNVSRSIPVMNILDILSSVTLLLVILANLWLFASASPMIWVGNIADDAFYYLGIARSLAEHGLFQFLPPFETNGFQPLWQGLLAGVAFIFGTSTRGMVVECYTLSAVFVALFILLSKRLNGSALAAVLSTILFPGMMLTGMETVMMPAFALLFFAATGWKARGLLGSLIFLSRLDAIALVVVQDVYVFIRRRELDLRHYAIILPVALIYATFNFLKFGVPLPVSGLAKSLHIIPFENIMQAVQYLIWAFPGLAILAVVFIIRRLSGNRPIEFKHGKELAVSLMSAFVCAGYYGSMSGWPLWDWYYWAPMLITYYALLNAIDVAGAEIAAGRYVVLSGMTVAVAAIIVVAGGGGYTSNTVRLVRQAYFNVPVTETFPRRNLELVDWIKSKPLAHGTMFAMGDRAGSFGYFLGEDYHFLHAEGLVADVAYYTALKKDDGLAYVKRQHIAYWVADREQYLEEGDVIGVPEPVQGMSMHKGGYLVCFNRSAITIDQSYPNDYSVNGAQYNHRYLLVMRNSVDCPSSLQSQFEALKARYGANRAFALPLEINARGLINPFFKKYLDF